MPCSRRTARQLAAVGAPLPVPRKAGWQGGGTWASQLADGRWITVRSPHPRRGPAFGVLFLALILVGVGVGAYPVVRRLTKRLERLQRGVERSAPASSRRESRWRAGTRWGSCRELQPRGGAHRGAGGRAQTLLANASHELRTPLARIRMALELGKDKREVEQDIAELDALIDEVLLASRLDTVATLENVEEVDLLALAAEEAARYDVEAQGEPTMMRGDPRLLRRMIRNLLENARRHGAPPIDVSVRNRELRVCDGGPGVAPADRERIFEPFNSKRGTGLGRPWCDRLRAATAARRAARAAALRNFTCRINGAYRQT